MQLVGVEWELPLVFVQEVGRSAHVDAGVVRDALDVAGDDGGDGLDQVLRRLSREPALRITVRDRVGVRFGVTARVKAGAGT